MYILQSENLKMHFTSYFYVININYASLKKSKGQALLITRSSASRR